MMPVYILLFTFISSQKRLDHEDVDQLVSEWTEEEREKLRDLSRNLVNGRKIVGECAEGTART